MPKLVAHIAAITHRGLVRSHNEDVVAVNDWVCGASIDEPQVASLPLETPVAILVCDGMGGHEAGEVASDLAARHLSAVLQGPPDSNAIERAIVETNKQIFHAAKEPERIAMGTTVAGLWLSDARSFWFNVGDSSVIRFANGFALKLSLDDVAGEQRSGALTQALGGAARFVPVVAHIGEESPKPGWIYLVCSDGLTDMVPLDNIERLLADGHPNAAHRLFEAAIAAGAADNVSLIVATIAASPEPEAGSG